MIFTPTALRDAFVAEIEPRVDARGFFARSWCQWEFEARGLNGTARVPTSAFVVRRAPSGASTSSSHQCGEVKLVRCTRGAVYDVIVDLRSDSSTYKRRLGVDLSADNHRMLYVPEGFAHGYELNSCFSTAPARNMTW